VVGLQLAATGGAPSAVTVTAGAATTKLEDATVAAAGIVAETGVPLKPGDNVRLAFDRFQVWGLVVRGAPSTQIRFAGLTPDEETQLQKFAQPAPAAPPAPVAASRPAPVAGPPPGFADRKPVRPQTTPPAGTARAPQRAPVVTPVALAARPAAPAAAAPTAAGAPAAAAPAVATPAAAAPAVPAASPSVADLFDDGAAADGAAAVAAEHVVTWPEAFAGAAAKNAGLQFLRDKTVPKDVPAHVAAAVRKLISGLAPAERALLEKVAPDSAFADALAARIALSAATAEGTRLASASPPAVVDGDAVTALTKLADEASAKLQKESNAAVSKGELESLQQVKDANAALSRDLLAFKATADRLRGIAAAPTLGAGALDPEVVLRGQGPRPAGAKQPEKQIVRPELRDFEALDDSKRGGWKKGFLALGVVALIASAANAYYFAMPRTKDVDVAALGPNVVRVVVTDKSSTVVVKPAWGPTDAQALTTRLRDVQVEKAAIVTEGGYSMGMLNVTTGTLSGYPTKQRPPK
jgi:hypothetical protein